MCIDDMWNKKVLGLNFDPFFACLLSLFWCLSSAVFVFTQVDCMEEALQRSQDNSHSPDLKVSVLLDYTRGSRGRWHFPLRSFFFFFCSCFPTELTTPIPLCFLRAGQINSRTMLLPLLQRFASQMRVSLYHTPDLRGLLRLLVPQRFNETIGVQHIKVYLFDDSIIISGYVDSWTESWILPPPHPRLLSPLFNLVLVY